MNRLSVLLVAAAAAAMSMFAMPALAAVPDDGPVAIERLDCTPASAADFAMSIVTPAVELFSAPAFVTCDAALLAETGLCLVEIAPARVGFAFAPPPDPFGTLGAGSCPPGRSTTS